MMDIACLHCISLLYSSQADFVVLQGRPTALLMYIILVTSECVLDRCHLLFQPNCLVAKLFPSGPVAALLLMLCWTAESHFAQLEFVTGLIHIGVVDRAGLSCALIVTVPDINCTTTDVRQQQKA